MQRVATGRVLWITIAVSLVLAFLGVTYVAGGGPAPDWLWFLRPAAADPVEASSPAEQVLRSMRLVGIEHATVGEQSDRAVVRIELPAVNNPADLELAWQAGFGSLAVAYPNTAAYVVQVFFPTGPLVEARADGAATRIAASGAADLRESIDLVYLAGSEPDAPTVAAAPDTPLSPTPGPIGYILRGLKGDPWHAHVPAPALRFARATALAQAAPSGATALPVAALSIDMDLSAEYLDAKNRAAGFVGQTGVLQGDAVSLKASAERSRAHAPGIPALPAGADAGEFWAKRALAELAASTRHVEQSERLSAELRRVRVGAQDPQPEHLRSVAMTVIAVESDGFGLAMQGAAELARDVAEVPLAHGAKSDAVLAAAQSARAPEQATVLVRFSRDEALDRYRDNASASDRIGAFLADGGFAGVTYLADTGAKSLSPSSWLAYRRADDMVYYLGGQDGRVALVDASVDGWAYDSPRIDVVDAANVGVVLGTLSGSD